MKPVVLVPTYGNIEPECEAALVELERAGIPVWRRFGCASVDKARSLLANEALSKGYDRLFWVDADIVFRPDDALALIEAEHPFCCGAYVVKQPHGGFALGLDKDTRVQFGHGGGWLDASACGFGFVAVSSEVFEALHKTIPLVLDDGGRPHRPYFLPHVSPSMHAGVRGQLQYHAEDYGFCYRARAAGYKLWCDTRIRLFHVGRYLYSWEDAALAVPRHASVVIDGVPSRAPQSATVTDAASSK